MNSDVPIWLRLTRHIVGMAAVAALNPFTINGFDSSGHFWSTAFFGSMLIGAVAAGIAALFFTRTQGGAEIPRNFLRVSWVFLALMLIGQWTSVRSPG